MAVDRVTKVLVAVHKGSGRDFLSGLQRQGFFHITKTEEAETRAGGGELDREAGRLEEAIQVLVPHSGKKPGLLGETKLEMSREEFERAAAEARHEELLERTRALSRRLEENRNRERSIRTETARLEPWASLDHVPAGLAKLGRVAVTFGRFADASELERAREVLAETASAVQAVAEDADGVSALVVSDSGEAEETGRTLSGLRFEPVDLKDLERRPAEVLAELARESESLARQREETEAELDELAVELPGLKAKSDVVTNELDRSGTEAALAKTETVVLVEGWVRDREMKRLEKLVDETGVAALSRVEPDDGEEPPVALRNPKAFRPFELVLDLYSMPSHRELDPTVLLAPFFALFFGFCLTDAGYGIVLVVLAALLMRKMGTNNKLLGMLFIGGFFTIVAGALVGGWFGDLPARLGIPALERFKDSLMWFDPLTNPMPFFILSIGFGYVHMMYGMVIEIVDCLRVRQVGDALLGQLPWFVALNALVALVLLGKSLPAPVSWLLLVLVLASVASILVFTRRAREIALAQTLWFGLFWLVLVYFAAKLGALPAGFGYAKWAVVAVFAGLYAYSFTDLLRARKLKAVPLVLAGLGVVAFGLWLAGVLPWVVAGLLGLAFFFTAPGNRKVGGKLAWGGYALYGATSYVGVVLSYIRIMALGMVTGGIAMAINTVAWMVTGIPVLGIILAVIALAVGHVYNIAVNVLGAFVHTLRLNYVEFFPRFFAGGGEPFVPFREDNRYVAVK